MNCCRDPSNRRDIGAGRVFTAYPSLLRDPTTNDRAVAMSTGERASISSAAHHPDRPDICWRQAAGFDRTTPVASANVVDVAHSPDSVSGDLLSRGSLWPANVCIRQQRIGALDALQSLDGSRTASEQSESGLMTAGAVLSTFCDGNRTTIIPKEKHGTRPPPRSYQVEGPPDERRVVDRHVRGDAAP